MTRRTRWLLRAAAALLLLAALAVAVGFHYFLGPLRRLSSQAWLAGHSRQERCDEVTRSASRIGWTHDESLRVGECDHRAVRRIMEDAERGVPLESMEVHLGGALQVLTNQDIAEDDAAAWLGWWTANRGRAQEEWIRDGFRAGGLDLHRPLTAGERITLLENLSRGSKLPPGWLYNSYRLLRDAGYVPWREAKLADLGTPPSEEALDGLVRYTQWLASEGPVPGEEPSIATPEFARRVALGLAAATLVALALLALSTRRGPAGTRATPGSMPTSSR